MEGFGRFRFCVGDGFMAIKLSSEVFSAVDKPEMPIEIRW
jgi:hypothetical protein